MAEDTTETTDQTETTESGGEDALGDAGKKALDAERKARRDAEKAAKKAAEEREAMEAELAKFREGAMSEQEKALEEARKEAAEAARQEVLAETRTERLKTKVEAAATGKFADPADAQRFVNLEDLDPDDTEAISEELDRVLEAKPYLKAGATQANGDIDQGARETDGVKQLTRAHLKTMTPDQIAEARAKGQLRDLMTTGR